MKKSSPDAPEFLEDELALLQEYIESGDAADEYERRCAAGRHALAWFAGDADSPDLPPNVLRGNGQRLRS